MKPGYSGNYIAGQSGRCLLDGDGPPGADDLSVVAIYIVSYQASLPDCLIRFDAVSSPHYYFAMRIVCAGYIHCLYEPTQQIIVTANRTRDCK